MSKPISTCLIANAVRNHKQSRLTLRARLFENRKCGHFTIINCPHKPRCKPSDQEVEDFVKEDPELAEIISDIPAFMAQREESTHHSTWGRMGLKDTARKGGQ